MQKRKRTLTQELERIRHLKLRAIAALFSSQPLAAQFVLKGGNALDLVFHITTRSSLDLDISMESDFAPKDILRLRAELESALQASFAPDDLYVFDVTFEEKPPDTSPELAHFWGGYSLTFKLLPSADIEACGGDMAKMRRRALPIGGKGKFEIDISKFEYCADKRSATLGGAEIFVYSPEMLVSEKLRAICQQMPEYGPVVKRSRSGSARARDFVDITLLIQRFSIEMTHEDNLGILRKIFQIKHVPTQLIARIPDFKDFHEADFPAVKDSIQPGTQLEDFDYYFDSVSHLAMRLSKALGHV